MRSAVIDLTRTAQVYRDDVLFFSIYPGSANKLDDTIRHVVGPVVERFRHDFDRWFFIRYSDLRGPHVRLRFIGDTPAANRRYGALHEFLTILLSEVAGSPDPGTGERLVRVPSGRRSPRSAVGVVPCVYEPEWSKYGGVDSLVRCERLFQQSSELALTLCGTGLRPAVTAAARLMQSGAAASSITTPRQLFWIDYARYWTGQEGPLADRLRSQLSEAAPRLSEQLGAGGGASLGEEVDAAVDTYAAALRSTIDEVSQTEAHLTPEHYCFHLTHMMNNRLGLATIEEALLAFVVAAGRHNFQRAEVTADAHAS
jgi:hypothetical protein